MQAGSPEGTSGNTTPKQFVACIDLWYDGYLITLNTFSKIMPLVSFDLSANGLRSPFVGLYQQLSSSVHEPIKNLRQRSIAVLVSLVFVSYLLHNLPKVLVTLQRPLHLKICLFLKEIRESPQKSLFSKKSFFVFGNVRHPSYIPSTSIPWSPLHWTLFVNVSFGSFLYPFSENFFNTRY